MYIDLYFHLQIITVNVSMCIYVCIILQQQKSSGFWYLHYAFQHYDSEEIHY